MPILGVIQPEIIKIDENIRLRRYNSQNSFALQWYQDSETLMMVDGKEVPYDTARLNKMYTYLDEHGELYFIEVKDDNCYVPIGDVTFWKDDMPIVIGKKEYRGNGIGKKVITKLIQRGTQLGYPSLFVHEVYNYNIGSQKLFESVGFKKYKTTPSGYRYRLDLV
ncbi:GNAT family N-acetyltransferase [Anaeromicropila herbilytica]|uniref:N-acetyltransferase domain-containing protein n=1 Tax=Anaeromicropila herbilytica TaxID=2785025 RepID=A0A7R7IEA3_9FIRM|nr:GNAT family N-acetyltransferase [Anaeromicropila herbilytica]BCN30908.1 hypothetical protein bsdtb5_22030 [Anaeromicropila herbilytica]